VVRDLVELQVDAGGFEVLLRDLEVLDIVGEVAGDGGLEGELVTRGVGIDAVRTLLEASALEQLHGLGRVSGTGLRQLATETCVKMSCLAGHPRSWAGGLPEAGLTRDRHVLPVERGADGLPHHEL